MADKNVNTLTSAVIVAFLGLTSANKMVKREVDSVYFHNNDYTDPGTGSGKFIDMAFTLDDANGRHGIHLTSLSGSDTPQALVAMGLDYGGVGLAVRVKDGGGVGIALDHSIGRDAVSKDVFTSTTSNAIRGTSYSTYSPLIYLIQANEGPNAATKAVSPLIELVSQSDAFSSANEGLTQKLFKWTTSLGEGGFINAVSGVLRAISGIFVSAKTDAGVPLRIKARATQTGHLLTVENDSEVPQACFDKDGKLRMAVNNSMGTPFRDLGIRTSDPTTGLADGDKWRRSDLSPPQYRERIGGVTYYIAMTAA